MTKLVGVHKVSAVIGDFASSCTLASMEVAKRERVALVTPIQIVPADQSVRGLRLNFIYGRNAAMTGLDLGIANHVAGRMSGVQWGAVNLADSMVGWQSGVVNYTSGQFEGFMRGTVNHAGHLNGLQLGLVNYAARARGIQIGLVNIIKQGGQFPVMVIANWGK